MIPQKLTQEQALVIGGYTGILCCDFGDLHAEIEKRLGRPVFTHEMPEIWNDQIQPAFKADFLAMIPDKVKGGAQ